MGVDYEMLVFWEELLVPPDEDEFRKKLWESYKAPEWLDRERLKAALIALDLGDLPIGWVIDDIVEGVAASISWHWTDYCRRQTGRTRPSKKLRDLDKALSAWIAEHTEDREQFYLSCAGDDPDDIKRAIVLLKRATGTAIGYFETARALILQERAMDTATESLEAERRQRRPEDPRTTFLRQLYRLYVDLSGKTGLSNDGYGPGYHFVKECAALFNIAVPRGLRQLILTQKGRAKMAQE
jgi:hypothetical protein